MQNLRLSIVYDIDNDDDDELFPGMFGDVFTTLPNINDEAFLRKQLAVKNR